MSAPHTVPAEVDGAAMRSVLGHFATGVVAITAIDPEAGWARTASRWYRLGRSIDALAAEVADSMSRKGIRAGALLFTLPGFTNVTDPQLLQRLLARYIERVHEIDAADRAASGQEH